MGIIYDRKFTICVLKHFLNKVDDVESQSILRHTHDLSTQLLQELILFFNKAELPIPEGFDENEVDLSAPLLTDEFYLLYLTDKARGGIFKYTQSLNYSSRSDI